MPRRSTRFVLCASCGKEPLACTCAGPHTPRRCRECGKASLACTCEEVLEATGPISRDPAGGPERRPPAGSAVRPSVEGEERGRATSVLPPPFGEDPRGLTLVQPWAWAIQGLGKDVENRPWAWPSTLPAEGAWVALHAGTKAVLVDGGWRGWVPSDDMRRMYEVADAAGWTWRKGGWTREGQDVAFDPRTLPRGAVVGAARLVPDGNRESPWCMGQVGAFGIVESRWLATPIRWRGMLGFWRVTEDLRAQLDAAQWTA